MGKVKLSDMTPEQKCAWYAEIGRKGGQTTRDRYGSAFYSEIGKIGQAVTTKRWFAGGLFEFE